MKMHPIRRISKNKNSRFKFIKDYFLSNIREYAVVGIMLLIGIFIGVMFINNCKENSKIQIENYINEYIQNFKNEDNIDYLSLTKVAIKKNIVLSVLLWFAGTTIIGIPIVFGIILFRGGCLGFSITACINTLGLGKGLSFILIAIFLQNIIFIPAIITSGVSSFNLYNAIAQKRKIKPEIIKHTLLSLMMMGILVISAIVEINVSCKILEKFIKYF
jgi:stage II sporulation protein M